MNRLRRALHAVAAWAADWRTGAVIVATGVVAYLIVSYVANYDTAQDALSTRNQTAAGATRRIDRLTAENDAQDARIEMLEREAGRRDAALEVLAEQVRRQGGDPIVVTVAQPAPSGGPPSTTSTTSTTTPTQPPPEEEPPDDCDGLDLLGFCFGG